MDKNKPKYKDIYKLIQKVEGIPEMMTDENDFFNSKENTTYIRALKNGYIEIRPHEHYSLKKEFESKVDFIEDFGDITKDGQEVPMNRYTFHHYDLIYITNNGKVFLDNYSKKINKIEYRAKDYPFLVPTITGFIGGILSSILLYLVIGK